MVARSNLARIRVYRGTFAQAATDQTGTISNFKDIRVNETEPVLVDTVIRDMRVRSLSYEQAVSQLGFRSGTIALSGQLIPPGVEIDASTAAPDLFLWSYALRALAGQSVAPGQGSVVASGASTTGVTVTTGHGTRYTEGQLVFVETASGSGLYEAAYVGTISTDGLTFPMALTFIPAVGAKVLNAQQLHPTNQPVEALQILWEGEDRDDIWLMLGCQGDLSLSWEMGAEVMWSAQITAASYLHDDDIATPQGGSAIGVATHTGGAPVIAKAGFAAFGPAGATTRVTPEISKWSIALNLGKSPVQSHNGLNGVAGFERTSVENPVLTIELPYVDETYHDARDAKTLYRFMAQAQNVGGQQLAFACPTVQIENVEKTLVNGMRYLRLTCLCLMSADCSDQTTDIRRAPWIMAGG